MQSAPDFRRKNLTQLRMMLRDTDPQQSPEQYRRLQAEIEAREEYHRKYGRKGGEESSGFLVGATIFAWCAYLLPFVSVVLFLLNLLGASSYSLVLYIVVLAYVIVMWALASFGIAVIRKMLREVGDTTAIKAWSLVAAAFAPASAFTYLVVIRRLLTLSDQSRYWAAAADYLPFLFAGMLGFYMPFVLLTFWLKYKYRQDEF